MPYVTTQEMLKTAQEKGYAVPAFNVENLEMLRGALEAAERARSPMILQAGWKTVDFFGRDSFAAAVVQGCRNCRMPVALHLDHATDEDKIIRCLEMGFSSIMYDGSALPFEENIENTREIHAYCMDRYIPVEAELGAIGGKEDDREADNAYTDPDQAALFVERTGVESLAVAIGTAHGVYKAKPKLDYQRLREIRKKVSVPLVLHGASGLSDAAVRACVRQGGICKVNFATELRQAFTGAALAYLQEHPAEYDLRVYLKPAIAAVRELCLHRMEVCGSCS